MAMRRAATPSSSPALAVRRALSSIGATSWWPAELCGGSESDASRAAGSPDHCNVAGSCWTEEPRRPASIVAGPRFDGVPGFGSRYIAANEWVAISGNTAAFSLAAVQENNNQRQCDRGVRRFSTGYQKRKKKRRRNNSRNKAPNESYNEAKAMKEAESKLPSMGDSGRPILTRSLLKQSETASKLGLTTSNARRILNNLKHRMPYKQHGSHASELGPKHAPMFISALRTEFDGRVLPKMSRDSGIGIFNAGVEDTDAESEGNKPPWTVELCSVGLAPNKKDASALAAIDLLVQLYEDCGVDARDPPDVKKLRRTRDEERLKKGVRDAQMILELVGVTRPRIEVGESLESGPRNSSWVATISANLGNGQRLRATGPPGKSKAEAQGFATIAAVLPGGPLEKIVPRAKLNAFARMIEKSPAGHVAHLRVRPLPGEAADALEAALGTRRMREERAEEIRRMRDDFDERFRLQERANNAGDRKGGGIGQRGPKSRLARLNGAMEAEEREREEKALQDPEGKQGAMKAVREALPITAIRENFLDALRASQVVVVSGGTGSGKSTQCPQYVLEDAIARGEGANTRIIVTQPRRIAASSVAERVAAERDERLGNSVGYAVRLNSVPPRDGGGSIEFVTTGVLLRRLTNNPALDGVSHVVIDEVHERDINTDFLLVLLKELIEKRPDLRVVLMSATLDAESFSDYFARDDGSPSVPQMSVPTKPRFPVETVHLEHIAGEGGKPVDGSPPELRNLAEDLLDLHDQRLRIELDEAEAEEKAALQLEGLSALEDEGKIPTDSSDSDSDDGSDDSDSDSDEIPIRATRSAGLRRDRLGALRRAVAMRGIEGGRPVAASPREQKNQAEVSEITVALAAKMAEHVARKELNAGRKGSVLCFLPGWDEIKAATELLEGCDRVLSEKMIIIPLHSTVPQEEQQKVFQPAPEGRVKLVLATNIAESSVTIDDVLAIVDSGLVREMNYDAEVAMSTMNTVTTSRASATQRTGRAGRVAPGTCYRLYSRGALEAMAERPAPEIQRTALEDTCLQTCSMTKGGVRDFLSRAMDPPAEESVSFALDRLEKLGAIDAAPGGGEELTALGRLLSRLPLDPGTGKMLVVGCVMKCLDPVLTAAACFSSRNPFYTPPGLRKEAREIRKSFCDNSDLMAMVRAYDTFEDVKVEQGWSSAKIWASDNYVSVAAMKTIDSVRSQLLHELTRIGLVHRRDLDRSTRRKKRLREDASVNQNAGSESLVAAVWATALPDNLSARRHLGTFGTMRTKMEDHTGLHPSSVAFHRKPPRERGVELPHWFSYHELVLSSQAFLRTCTAMKPEQILLFGGNCLEKQPSCKMMTAEDSTDIPVLDEWAVVDSRCENTIDILSSARRDAENALAFKVMKPRRPLPQEYEGIIDAISETFSVLEERDGTQYTPEQDNPCSFPLDRMQENIPHTYADTSDTYRNMHQRKKYDSYSSLPWDRAGDDFW